MEIVFVILVSEEDAHRFQEKDFKVSIQGWSRKRNLHWRGQRLILEIAMKDCMCGTCIRRFESVLFSMKDRNVSYEAGSWSGDCSLLFVDPNGFDESKICSYLSERIGLTVSEMEEIQIESSEQK